MEANAPDTTCKTKLMVATFTPFMNPDFQKIQIQHRGCLEGNRLFQGPGPAKFLHFRAPFRVTTERRPTSTNPKSPTETSIKKKMLDTLRVKAASLPILSDRENELLQNESSAWVVRSGRLHHSYSDKLQETASVYHRDTGFYANITDGNIEGAQGSLPRLLNRPNGFQIKTPPELDAACGAFLYYLSFLNNSVRLEDLKVTRVDLVLNIPFAPRVVLAVHRNAKHPMIRRETELYHNDPPKKRWGNPPHYLDTLNTVRFHGTRTTISIYDKVREVLSCKGRPWPDHGKCTRVEIQLHGAKHIAIQLGLSLQEYVTPNQLEIERCYRAYRRILLQFEHVGCVPMFKADLASCLAVMEHHPEIWKTLGMRPMDWYRTSKGVADKRFREVRSKVRKHQLQLHGFRWADVLPEDRLPDIVDVDHEGDEKLIPSPTSFPRSDMTAG